MIITLDKYQDLIKLDSESPRYEYDLIQICYDLTDDELDELDIENFSNYVKEIDTKLLTRTIAPNSKYYGKPLVFNVENVTFGEFIDLETFLKNEDYNNFLKIFFKLPTEDFLLSHISIFFNVYDVFKSFQETIYTSYAKLFGELDEEPIDDEDLEFISPTKRYKDSQDKIKSDLNKKYGWVPVAFTLANKDITKLDAVLNLEFIYCLNILMMVKELQIDINNTCNHY